MAHSNQMRECMLSDRGIDLVDVYVGPGVVHTGTARLNQQARDRAEVLALQQTGERRQRELEVERGSLQAQLTALEARLANLKAEQRIVAKQEKERAETSRRGEVQMARARRAD
jgi:circadian clock protein KaiC